MVTQVVQDKAGHLTKIRQETFYEAAPSIYDTVSHLAISPGSQVNLAKLSSISLFRALAGQLHLSAKQGTMFIDTSYER